MTTEAEDLAVQKHWLAPWCQVSDLSRRKLSNAGDVTLEKCIGAATDVLFVMSGRQYRQGRSIVRPVAISSSYGTQSYLYPYSSMSGYGAAWGFAAGWSWTAVGMGWWQNGQDLSELVLQGPIRRINRIMSTGKTLGGWAPGETNPNYQVFDGRRVVRTVTPGGGSDLAASQAWPWNQQLQLPLTSPGTFMVDYEWGKPPPDLGSLACVELATELALTLTGEDDAKLPARVSNIAMQGLNVAVGDPLVYLREDLIGLPLVDLFLQRSNPNRLRRRSVFLSPNSVLGREMKSFPGQGRGPG